MGMSSLIKQFLVAKGKDWSGSTFKHKLMQEKEKLSAWWLVWKAQ